MDGDEDADDGISSLHDSLGAGDRASRAGAGSGGHAGSHAPSLHGGSDAGSQKDEWLQGILRTLADTTRALAAAQAPKGDGKGRRNLQKIKIDDFFGGPTVTPLQYRMWKKHVFAVKRLHGLTDP